ncbi:MAG: DNA polymerase ligase N-terminal domain-containing protein [Gemmataceae bacterium]
MPRYVILTHDHPHLHWDFMIEVGPVLRTWRLDRPPEPDVEIRAEPLGDHRLTYLNYEGPLSGDRGRVTRWDAGSYEFSDCGPTELVMKLAGGRLCGTARLTETNAGWRFLLGGEQ